MSAPESAVRILRLAQPPLRQAAPGLLFGVLGAACAVALLGTSAWLITRAADAPSIIYLSVAVVGVRAFAVFRAAFRYVERLASHDAALRRLGRLRAELVERIEPLAPDGLAGIGRGELLSRFARDVDTMPDLPVRVVQPAVVAGLVGLGGIVALAVISPVAAFAAAVVIIAAAVLACLAQSALASRAERRIAPLRGAFADELLATLSAFEALVAFGAVGERFAALDRLEEGLARTERRVANGAGAATGILALGAGFASAIGLAIGVPELTGGSLDAPLLAVLVLLPLAIVEVVGAAPGAVSAWRTVRSSAQRIATAVPEEVPAGLAIDPVGAVETAPDGVPRLELRSVTARWPGGDRQVGPYTLTIAPGERLLVRAPSGTGKTTLAHVLVRFLDYGGDYRLDGIPARSMPQDALRRSVGLCEQHPWIFDTSLRENLRFARPDATDDDLLAVLDRVGLAGWARARDGLDTPLGERGARVSGGQAQRIALARALLADFPVLVLDEPTAGVDDERADVILTDILTAAAEGGRSVVLFSHASVPAGLVDREVLLRNGDSAAGR